MNIKLTFRYLLSIAIVAVIVVLINITIIYLSLYSKNTNSLIKYDGNNKITSFVRNFEKYIDLDEDNRLYIDNNGKDLIDNSNSWVQILDENNKEVYSYNKPQEIKNKYTPIDIINGYKYTGGLGGSSQILAGYKEIDNITYTYLIGYPSTILTKYVFIIEMDTINIYIKYAIISILIVDFIIAIIFGYIFSKGITKPVKAIIDGVDHLYNGDYEVYFKEKGIYKNVLKKLNSLSYKLKENELERKKIDKMRADWIANISHDIKTPLSSIKGYAEFLEQDYDFSSEDIKSFAGIINNKSDYIKELVEELNLSMKLKNNESILKKEKVNIVSLVKNSVIDILNDSEYSKVDIKFECSEDKIFIDIDKVGIHGHSGGGFMSTAAMCQYPDFFKVAVSCAGNHDNNIYNRWWSETHHGVKEVVSEKGDTTFVYKIATNPEIAKQLKGNLLLIHGDIDNNVHPGNTLRVVDALIRAGKRFDMLILPQQRHGFGDMNEYFYWKLVDYFSEHLKGKSEKSVDIPKR